MHQKQLYLELNQAFNSLFHQLSAVPRESYNRPSAEGKWTFGQLADHLRLSAQGFLRLVNGPVESREGPPDAKIPVIRQGMLDLSQKFQSPPDIVPGNGSFDRDEQAGQLNQLQQGWLEAVRMLDPAPTCLLYPLPGIGLLTRQEAGYFLLYHMQRHLQQMEMGR